MRASSSKPACGEAGYFFPNDPTFYTGGPNVPCDPETGHKRVDTYNTFALDYIYQQGPLREGYVDWRVSRAVSARFDLEAGRVVIDGSDVSQAIRTPEIDAAATTVARHPAVRRVLVARQQDIGRAGGVVMEGRDIGTVVFPDADVKIYLDASPEERARRRATDPAHRSSTGAALSEVATALAERDRSDSTRAASPLSMAPDAILIETTGIGIESVVERVMAIVEERRNSPRRKT